MANNEHQIKVHVEHNLDEVEASLDRIISKAEKAGRLLQNLTDNPNTKQEAFLD